MKRTKQITLALGVGFILLLGMGTSCQEKDEMTAADTEKQFVSIGSSYSGIDFQNKIIETEESNYYQYMYSYIGGGVAAADFNNDGNEDLFFVSNTFENKLYLNQGDFKFLDATEQAGIKKRDGFDAGVSIVDINADGLLDIYLSRGGGIDKEGRFANMLYVNQGISKNEDGLDMVSFVEQAESFGLADANRSISSTFFDFDKDGDLDVYIANSPDFIDRASEIVDLIALQTDPKTLEQKGSDKLYRNNGDQTFTDISIQAGIMPDLGFGLNPQLGDLNNDGWLDIYVCNDFRIPDFAYINQGDGTFKEGRDELVKHMSFNSMGSDYADINNDGLPDLYTLDMNPEDYVRSKTTMGMTSLDRFDEMVNKGYHYNYMHNMLQLNNGNGTFSEISNMAGVANTDWSWAALLADFDLDGFNDIYVTNGVFRDVIDRDANNSILQELRANGRKPTKADFLKFTKMLPQQKLNNYFFKNNGDLSFDNVSSSWADAIPTFSNGAVYADLDNDGDLDIVVNNINSEATILKNTASEQQQGNFLQIKLKGPETNPYGLGTMVKLRTKDGAIQVRQLINARGFLSSVSNKLHFGLGRNDSTVALEILWEDGKNQQISTVKINQILTVDYEEAIEREVVPEIASPLFVSSPSSYQHIDPVFNDYESQILLPHKLSQTGPVAAKADVNGDGLEDLFIGGGRSQASQLLIANTKGGFINRKIKAFELDRQKEDVGACFFDVDQDNDLDLYVVSGSYEFSPDSRPLADRLYLNDGKGNYTKNNQMMPVLASAGSVASAADYDNDGDMDLFVGGRVIPGAYPYAPNSYLLINNGGGFEIGNEKFAPEITQLGMVNDANWVDIDQDGDTDLIVTGEWMGIEVLLNESGRLIRSNDHKQLGASTGWWNRLIVEDVDQDGDKDIIAGNLGLNYKFHASFDKPFHVYTHDFDYNGTVDVFLAKEYNGTEVPIRGKTCSSQQLPHLANKIPSFNEFASLDIEGILGPTIRSALHYTAVEFRSGIFYQEQDSFRFEAFPLPVQQSPVNSMIIRDFDGDGIDDLLLAGNNYMSEVETTRADAGIGVFLKGRKDGSFDVISHQQSGFFANKDVRQLIDIHTKTGVKVFVINNNDQHEIFHVNNTAF